MSSSSQQWSGSSHSTNRSRFLALVALLLLWLVWYNHGRKSSSSPGGPNYDTVNWSKFAYSQYATTGAHLCNSVMVFEALHRLGSRADRILFYPSEWDTTVSGRTDRDSQLLLLARDRYKVKLFPVNMQSVRAKPTEDEGEVWDFSMNMFHAWNQTQYHRVMHLNSAVTLFQHLDDLFFLPDAPVAMTRAYWQLPKIQTLAPVMVLLKPSQAEYDGLLRAAYDSELKKRSFGEEILNERYWDSALVLPHRDLVLISQEFRKDDHRMYMGSYEKWIPANVLNQTRMVKFDDDPLPKPWVMWPSNLLGEILPKCKINPGMAGESGCEDRDEWKGLYNEYRQRRKDICRLLSIPAPQWPPPRKGGSSRWDD